MIINPYTFSVNYRNAVMSDSPIAYWRLADISGSSAADETGAHPGTYIGSPTKGVSGPNTDAVHIEAGKYMQTASLGSLAVFTVEIWVKRHGAMANSHAFIADSYPNYVNFTLCPYDATIVGGGIFHPALGWFWVPAFFLPDEQWVHLAFSFDGYDMRVYFDGALISTTSAAVTPESSGGMLYIGRRWDAAQNPNCDMCDVAVYPTVLTPSRIAAHYDARWV